MALSFLVEWVDPTAQLVKQFQLTYHDMGPDAPPQIEMFDLKTRRQFLKKCPYRDVSSSDLFVGSTVTVYSRQLKVVDYCDAATRAFCEKAAGSVTALIPHGSSQLGEILSAATGAGLKLSGIKSSSDGVLVGIVGPNAEETLASISSGMDARLAAASVESAPGAGATFRDCTLCIIKPHLVRTGKVGNVITAITNAGFEINAVQSFTLNRVEAEEFYEVYKNVVPEYNKMVEQLISGAVVAMEIRGDVNAFREFCGPADVDIAQELRPSTLRAKFGVNEVQNAVHCTDLPEDGVLESEYFFKILAE